MLVSCAHCEKELDKKPYEIKRTKNNFCSRSCSASFHNKIYPKNKPKIRYCACCSQEFYRNETNRYIYCLECHNKKKYTSVKEKKYTSVKEKKNIKLCEIHNKTSLKNKHPSWKNSYVRLQNRNWNKNLRELPCQKCGYLNHVELAHKKPISSFGENATLGEINDPNNILVLCRNCHWEFDHDIFSIDDIPGRK